MLRCNRYGLARRVPDGLAEGELDVDVASGGLGVRAALVRLLEQLLALFRRDTRQVGGNDDRQRKGAVIFVQSDGDGDLGAGQGDALAAGEDFQGRVEASCVTGGEELFG